jgi:hypothetical protein
MKKISLLLSILLFFIATIRQGLGQNASYETVFYFTDAGGSEDSIIFGFDDEANFTYNPQFGEQEILTPYNDEFEVRSSRICFYSDCLETKKIISNTIPLPTHPNGCFGVGGVVFWIHSDNFPIKVEWDSSFFAEQECLLESFLTKDELVILFTGVEVPIKYESLINSCLANKSTWIINLGDIDSKELDYVPIVQEITNEAGMLDTVFGIFIFISPIFSPIECEDKISSVGHVVDSPNRLVTIAPNPTHNSISLTSQTGRRIDAVSIFNAQGALIKKDKPGMDIIDLADMPVGIYYLRVTVNGASEVHKVLKHK